VDVVDPRSNAVVEAAGPNVCDDRHARAGRLDTRDVGIQVADRVDDDAELRIAQAITETWDLDNPVIPSDCTRRSIRGVLTPSR